MANEQLSKLQNLVSYRSYIVGIARRQLLLFAPLEIAVARATFNLVVHTVVKDRNERLLLLRRANTGFMDGMFSLPGGYVETNEQIEAAARRECLEETGIHIHDIQPLIVMPFENGVDFIWMATKWFGTPQIGEPEHCSELLWSDPNNLPDGVVPFLKVALQSVKKGLWYKQFTD